MVANLTRWREERLSSRAAEYLSQNKHHIKLADQDALNAMFAGSWGEIDPRWNATPSTRLEDRLIVHFSGRKPWRSDCEHSANSRFDNYLRKSGWFGRAQWFSYFLPLQLRRTLHKIRRVTAELLGLRSFASTSGSPIPSRDGG